jgi:hypothetical protein
MQRSDTVDVGADFEAEGMGEHLLYHCEQKNIIWETPYHVIAPHLHDQVQ